MLLLTTLLSGCAASPEYYETEKSTGRIIATHYNKEVTGKPIVMQVPLLINDVFVKTGIEIPSATPDVYIYALRKNDGEIFFTQSIINYNIGECLRLWHPPATVDLQDKYYFVTGTLQNSTECN